MTILHITQIGLNPNGIASVLEALVPEQRALNHTVVLASTNAMGRCGSLSVENISSEEKGFALLQNVHPDIVIFHSLYNKLYPKFANFCQKQKIPYAVMLHGALSEENYKKNHFKKWLANLLFFKKFLRKASSIIYLNQGEYNNSIVPKFNKNYVIIPNGCYLPAQVQPHAPNHPIKIIYMGRIEPVHKGLDVLFEALEICKKKQLPIEVDFYGNFYEETKEKMQQCMATLSPLVRYKGLAYGEEKDKVFRSADIFILTSRYEGMPMGVLEALSYGIPCILTSATNLAETVVEAHAGWQCELNAQNIADVISKAVEEYKQKHEDLFSASTTLAKRFSWSNIATISIEKYKTIIG